MLLRFFMFYFTVAAFNSCKTENKSPEVLQSTTYVSSGSSDTGNADKDFNAFIKQFSKDTGFQRSRTKFPLRIKQYDIDNEKDTIIFEERLAFKIKDFRKERSESTYDQWKQEIILDNNQTKATIEIRGIENGIMVDYYFEKKDGKWMLVSIDDSST